MLLPVEKEWLKEGIVAFENKLSLDANPHPENSEAAAFWKSGWEDAQDDYYIDNQCKHDEGNNAFHHGLPLSMNPYPEGTQQNAMWLVGYTDAAQDAEDDLWD